MLQYKDVLLLLNKKIDNAIEGTYAVDRLIQTFSEKNSATFKELSTIKQFVDCLHSLSDSIQDTVNLNQMDSDAQLLSTSIIKGQIFENMAEFEDYMRTRLSYEFLDSILFKDIKSFHKFLKTQKPTTEEEEEVGVERILYFSSIEEENTLKESFLCVSEGMLEKRQKRQKESTDSSSKQASLEDGAGSKRKRGHGSNTSINKNFAVTSGSKVAAEDNPSRKGLLSFCSQAKAKLAFQVNGKDDVDKVKNATPGDVCEKVARYLHRYLTSGINGHISLINPIQKGDLKISQIKILTPEGM
jgi:hypothetical protein